MKRVVHLSWDTWADRASTDHGWFVLCTDDVRGARWNRTTNRKRVTCRRCKQAIRRLRRDR